MYAVSHTATFLLERETKLKLTELRRTRLSWPVESTIATYE